MSNRSIAILLAFSLMAACALLIGAAAENTGARYAIATASAETAGGYILEVFAIDTKTGVVKHVVSDHQKQLGIPFEKMKPSF